MPLKREGSTAWKVSKNNKSLIFRNFLPIESKSLFDEMVTYLDNLINNNSLIDITSLRQEKNGTLILQNTDGNKYGIYNGEKGYIRFIKQNYEGIYCEILNKEIKHDKDSSSFYESIEPVKYLDQQLYSVVKHIIYSS